MTFDQAQSPRLGQRTPVESTYVQMFNGADLPEAAWPGQIIYRNESQNLQIYNGDNWENVVGGAAGQLTFIGPTVPVSQHVGDIWINSADFNRMYVAASAGADEIKVGEWEDVTGAVPPITESTWIYHQDTPPGLGDTPVPKENDFWFETPDNLEYYYKAAAPGTHWVAVRDAGIQQALDGLTAQQDALIAATNDLNSSIDGKATTYFGFTPPWPNGSTGHAVDDGDLWFDTDDANKLYRWVDSTKLWTLSDDQRIGSTITTVNGKVTTFYQTAPPLSQAAGDLWVDTDDGNKLYRASAPLVNAITVFPTPGWWVVQDALIPTIKTIADNKTTNFVQTTIPTSTAVGDTWVDTAPGHGNRMYVARIIGANEIKSGEWEVAQDAAFAQSTASGKNKVTYSTASPGTSPNAVGDIWYQYVGTKIITQWSGLGGIAWQQVQLSGLMLTELDAGSITTGFLSAAHMTIGNANNVVRDPSFSNTGTWTLPSNAYYNTAYPYSTTNTVPPSTYSDDNGQLLEFQTINDTVGGQLAYEEPFPVLPGEQFKFSGRYERANTYQTVGSLIFRFYFYDADMNVAASAGYYRETALPFSGMTTTLWHEFSMDITIPDGVAFGQIYAGTAYANATGGYYRVDDIRVMRMVTGDLLVNGAIDGTIVTGATLQTATAGQRMVMRKDSAGGILEFFTGLASEAAGTLDPSIYSATKAGVSLNTGTTPTNPWPASITLAAGPSSTTPTITFTGQPTFFGNAVNMSSAVVTMNTSVTNGNHNVGTLTTNGGINLQGFGSVSNAINVTGTGNVNMNGSVTGSNIIATNAGVSVSAANVRYNPAGSGEYLVNTSLTKHKVKIKQVSTERLRKILDVPIVEFYDRREWLDNGRKTTGLQRVPGVLAEDVEKADPLWADYWGDELSGVMYDRLGVALIPLVKDLYDQIETLEARLSDLERRSDG